MESKSKKPLSSYKFKLFFLTLSFIVYIILYAATRYVIFHSELISKNASRNSHSRKLDYLHFTTVSNSKNHVHTVDLNKYDNQVDIQNTLQIRKVLSSMEMTSENFFNPSELNSISQLDQLPEQDSCAVIGSSGILKGSACGSEIDSHDFVIRENMAPVKGYESDVGNRTSLMTSNDAMTKKLVRCLTNPSKPCHKQYKDVLKGYGKSYFGIPVYVERSGSDRKSYDKFTKIVKVVNPALDVRLPLNKFRGKILKYWKLSKMPSGGFVNINIAFTFCRRISLYGFFPFARDLNKRPLHYHYYDRSSIRGTLGAHNMPVEYRIYTELHRNHTVRHVTRPCNTGS